MLSKAHLKHLNKRYFMADALDGPAWHKAKLRDPLDIVVLVVLVALVTGAVLSKIFQYYDFQIHDWDTGIYSNVVWNLATGDGFQSDVLNVHDLGEHFSPIVAIFVPAYLIAPSPLWLLGGQGLAVGATYVLLYFIGIKIFSDAKTRLVKPLALAFAVWAFFYRPLTSALLFEFHPSTLATPLLAGAILALLHRRDTTLWLLAALLLLSKENAALAVLGLGCYAGLVMLRPRLGLALAAVAGVSAALIMGVIMPHFRTSAWEQYDRLAPFADWHGKTIYLFALLEGLAFLPLASWRGLLCAIPPIALNLSVNASFQYSMNYHYDDFASVFLLVAAMHGAVVVLGLVHSAFSGLRVVAAYAVVVFVAVLLAKPQTHSAFDSIESSWPGAQERQLRHELAKYRSLPSDVGIAAQQALGPYLSTRARYFALAPRLQEENLPRLKMGDKLLITPFRNPEVFADLQRLLDGTAGIARVSASPLLHVYEVKKPLN